MSSQAMRTTIYGLKRQYGRKMVLQYGVTVSVDLETGDKLQDTVEIVIPRAIVLPVNLSTFTNPVISGYLLQGKGGVSANTRFAIIDNRDLKGVNLKIRYAATVEGKTYTIESIESLLDYAGHLVKMVQTE
jgi:hypothetical protein